MGPLEHAVDDGSLVARARSRCRAVRPAGPPGSGSPARAQGGGCERKRSSLSLFFVFNGKRQFFRGWLHVCSWISRGASAKQLCVQRVKKETVPCGGARAHGLAAGACGIRAGWSPPQRDRRQGRTDGRTAVITAFGHRGPAAGWGRSCCPQPLPRLPHAAEKPPAGVDSTARPRV